MYATLSGLLIFKISSAFLVPCYFLLFLWNFVVYHTSSHSFLFLLVIIEHSNIFCRYLFVRWGIDPSNTVVFVGECGDTDYEGLLGGVHKTVILKGAGTSARELHANRSYPLEHVVPFDGSNIVLAEGSNSNDIIVSLQKLGVRRG